MEDSFILNYSGPQVNNAIDIVYSLLDHVYPVGSIYMSVSQTSPATLFGGTWAKIEGKFLLGASSEYTNASSGGNASVTLTTLNLPSHTHTFNGSTVTSGNQNVGHTHTVTVTQPPTVTGSTAITIDQMPSHSHAVYLKRSSAADGSNRYTVSSKGDSTASITTGLDATGGGKGHTHSITNTSATHTTSGISSNHTHSVTTAGTNENTGGGWRLVLCHHTYLSISGNALRKLLRGGELNG